MARDRGDRKHAFCLVTVPLNPAFCVSSCQSLVLGWELETLHTYPTANSVQPGPTWLDGSTQGPAVSLHAESLILGWEGFACVAWLKIKDLKWSFQCAIPRPKSLPPEICSGVQALAFQKKTHTRSVARLLCPGSALGWVWERAGQATQVPCPAVCFAFSFPVSVQVVSLVHFLSVCLSVSL